MIPEGHQVKSEQWLRAIFYIFTKISICLSPEYVRVQPVKSLPCFIVPLKTQYISFPEKRRCGIYVLDLAGKPRVSVYNLVGREKSELCRELLSMLILAINKGLVITNHKELTPSSC